MPTITKVSNYHITSGLKFLAPQKEIKCCVNEGFENPDEIQTAFLGMCIKRLADYDPSEFTAEDIVASTAIDFFGLGEGPTPVNVVDQGNVIVVM